ncbi:MAG: hypothetical protein CVU56_09830 [Deltaproteobacteria bacterium HGW-Deltaproteobacteria-14]|jgi:predicted small lipoprotein YifL|nr:MAG: hypothetical protein CVU56_09830 [Deltaproteobacteria bacterium HGW-Deltaproteobacteria-14]
MRRTILVLLLSAGLVAACGKKEPAPPATTTAPADPTAADPAKDPAAAATPDKGEEANQPRRAIEVVPTPGADEASAGAAGDTVAKADGIPEPTPAGGGDEASQLEAMARLTPGPQVDLGAGAATAEALSYLPANTAVVFVVGSPMKLLDVFGYAQLRATGGERMAEAARELTEATGHDLLDPTVWTELGIDLNGPMGGAGVASEKEPYIIFLTIGDRAKLDAAITAAFAKGEREITREQVGDAELIMTQGYDRNVILVRGKTVMVVGVDRHDGARELARKVATQDAATSLARAVEFTAAVKPLEGSQDALVWGNLGLGVRMMMRTEAGGGRRAAAQKAMFDKVLKGVSGVAMGGTVKDRALEVSAFMPLAGDALLRRLIKNFDGLPVAFTASSQTPLFGMALRLDPAVVVEFMEASMAAEGESLDEVRAAAKEMAGVDLDKDVFGVFDGRASVVVTGDLSGLAQGKRFDPKALGGALVIGLANADGLKSLLGMASKMELPKGIKIDPSGTMDLPLPTGHTLYVRIAGNNLLATTDKALAKRVVAGDASASFLTGLSHPDLKALMSRPNQAGWFMMPQQIAGLWLMVGKSDASMAMRAADADDGATKKSPERIAKEKELAALRASLEETSKARDAAQMAAATKLFDKLGTFAETVEVTEGGLRVRAGEYLGGTPAELVSAIVGAMRQKDDSRAQEDGLYKKLFELENEVRMLELKDDMEAEEK